MSSNPVAVIFSLSLLWVIPLTVGYGYIAITSSTEAERRAEKQKICMESLSQPTWRDYRENFAEPLRSRMAAEDALNKMSCVAAGSADMAEYSRLRSEFNDIKIMSREHVEEIKRCSEQFHEAERTIRSQFTNSASGLANMNRRLKSAADIRDQCTSNSRELDKNQAIAKYMQIISATGF